MNKKRIIITWVIGILLLSGCATIGSINRNIASVNYSDGVNSEEAKFIAQKYCVDSDNCDCKGYAISSAHVADGDGEWVVSFTGIRKLFTVLYVYINKETGKVANCGIDGI